MSEVKPLKKLEGYAILANQMNRDELDINKINEKYGNSLKQLANWMRSLTVTDYGYKYLKKEGYTEDQIADWVRRTPAEKKVREVRPKSSPENSENLLREGENPENVKSSPENLLRTPENLLRTSENLLRTGETSENLLRTGETSENSEDENLRIPKPEGNKGTQSTGGSQSSPLTFSQNPQEFSHGSQNSQEFSHGSQNSQEFSLSELSPEQLSALGMMRDGKGAYFHVSNTEYGGYRLSPATQESLAGAVAGAQRQAQQIQQQTQQNQQSDLMQKISENAVDQFQVNIQAIVRKVVPSPIDYMGFTYLQDTIKHHARAHLSIIVTI